MKRLKTNLVWLIFVLIILENMAVASDNITIFEMYGVKDHWMNRLESGDTCWVLTEDKNGRSELLRTTVGIDTFTNYNPFDAWYFLDYRYTIDDIDSTWSRIMIFTGLNNLNAGRIDVAKKFRGIITDAIVSLSLDNSNKYLLSVSTNVRSGTYDILNAKGPTVIMRDYSIIDYHLFLTDLNVLPHVSQKIEPLQNIAEYNIYTGEFYYGNMPSLVWAGDLDQDKKLGLIFLDAPDTYDQCFVLYLSSIAGDSLLVMKAGSMDDPHGE